MGEEREGGRERRVERGKDGEGMGGKGEEKGIDGEGGVKGMDREGKGMGGEGREWVGRGSGRYNWSGPNLPHYTEMT